ncbi:hypothetical protein [Variovorax sp. tm]|uniref:hypothetical protein n=1 Tax=Variovorax atrisoli TaxID=3394203 RepID=UPI003A7FE0F3
MTSSSILAVVSMGDAEAALHGHIARTLKVAARHLPWVVARELHALHQDIVPMSASARASSSQPLTPARSPEPEFASIELDAVCWRVDVSDANVAAAHALGWGLMRDLLRLARRHACEALRLCPEHAALPPELRFEVFEWP